MPETFAGQVGIDVDGTPLDDAVVQLLERVVVDDYLHAPDMFVLTFRDIERTVLADARLRIGSKVKVTAGSVGGTSPEPLIEGEVTTIEASYDEGGSLATVRGYDPSHRLHRGRRTTSYQGMKDSDIAGEIARRHTLRPGTIDDSGPVLPHVSQANQTDWEFLAQRAREIGFEVAVADGALSFRRPARSTDAPSDGDYDSADPLQLVFGQELIEFHPRISSAEQVKEVVVRGWDYVAKEKLEGRAPAAASSAELRTSPSALAALFGDPVFVAVDRPLASQAAVDATARALSDRIGSGFAEAHGVARGNPKLRAGAAISIGVVADDFAGKYVITSSQHVFDRVGYRTRFSVSGRQDRSLLGLAGTSGNGATSSGQRMTGVVPAIVTSNDDPEGLGRVKVKFPWLADDYESHWARIAIVGGGPDSGVTFLPEVNDEVLVAFGQGDVREPYVIGALWNGQDKPRLGDGLVDNGAVRRRGIVSRQGHRAVFFDAADQSGIALITADGKLRIALKQTGTEIHVASDGTISIESSRDLTIKAGANLTIEASGSLELKGSAGVKVQSGAVVDIDGATIQLN